MGLLALMRISTCYAMGIVADAYVVIPGVFLRPSEQGRLVRGRPWRPGRGQQGHQMASRNSRW